jgi:archaellum biogenesis protein FlaJ (TadC family)
MKYQTEGLDPKVPVQAIAIILVFILTKVGIDLDLVTSFAISTVIGFVAAFFAPAPKTKLVPKKQNGEAGYTLVEMAFALLLVVVALVILFYFLK